MHRSTLTRRVGTLLAAGLSLGGLLAGCGKEQPKGPPVKAPVPVRVGQATTRTIPQQLRAVGAVEARSTVEIRARVGGQLTKVHFREGRDVKKGALLFTIDPTPYQVALRQAEARLQQDQALAASAREKERRYQVLTGEGLISRQDFELIKAEAESLEAAVSGDRAAVDEARLQLSWCHINAPLTGRTGSLMAHVGDLVAANGSPPLLIIHQIEPIDVAFTIPEQELARVRGVMQSGALPVDALLPGEEQKPETGELSFIDNAVDTKTGTIRLKASFGNSARRLWPGQFVTVLITLGNFADATVVPTAAIQTGQQGTFVYVARSDSSAELRPVKTGIAYNGVTIISDGIKPGESIVIDGQLRLYPDAKLDIKDK